MATPTHLKNRFLEIFLFVNFKFLALFELFAKDRIFLQVVASPMKKDAEKLFASVRKTKTLSLFLNIG
jgi:hypothetical protein